MSIKKLKPFITVAGIMLLLASAAMGYFSAQRLSSIIPASDYEDKGVYSFVPVRVLPVQVENTGATGRARRMNPTKTVYVVHYRDTSKKRLSVEIPGSYPRNGTKNRESENCRSAAGTEHTCRQAFLYHHRIGRDCRKLYSKTSAKEYNDSGLLRNLHSALCSDMERYSYEKVQERVSRGLKRKRQFPRKCVFMPS